MTKSTVFYTILFFFISAPIFGQDTIAPDSKKPRKSEKIDLANDSVFRSPKKAALLSALLPGAGQIYNHAPEKGKRRLWKAPIVWAGLGTASYFLLDNTKNIKELRTEYLWRLNTELNPNSDFENSKYEFYTTDNVRTALDQYKDWRDLSVVAMAGIYILQIVDASVDAHLFNHDVSADLSMNILPQIRLGNTSYVGVGITLFRKK